MDGVWRNFGKDGKVFSYRTLSPEEIKEVVGLFGESIQSRLKNRLEGVDGRDVKDMEQLLHPGAEIMPPLSDSEDLECRQVKDYQAPLDKKAR